ncbi:PadR family transcriptional regulator [Roseburia faecis]|uniref:PadR family transcriptional regulator n=2 Tax=Roseburia faecis TaxID=301302 RepID=UPI0032EC531D
MNNKSNFRRGSVELLILHLLSQQDYYGYEISTLIREQTDGYLNIPVGSLYPALYKLIDAGYISDYKKQVGDPQELVNDYFSEQSIDKQKRSLRFSRNVKITCTIVILIVLGCTGIFFYTLNHLAQEERNAFIHREIIILKEDDTQ